MKIYEIMFLKDISVFEVDLEKKQVNVFGFIKYKNTL